MGDVAKGIKSFKKGMSDDSSTNSQDDNSKSDNSTLKINNQNASDWMVRDFISCYNLNISFKPKRISNCLKRIGFYIGKLKKTLSNFQKEVSKLQEK